jgi:hypothetical protein
VVAHGDSLAQMPRSFAGIHRVSALSFPVFRVSYETAELSRVAPCVCVSAGWLDARVTYKHGGTCHGRGDDRTSILAVRPRRGDRRRSRPGSSSTARSGACPRSYRRDGGTAAGHPRQPADGRRRAGRDHGRHRRGGGVLCPGAAARRGRRHQRRPAVLLADSGNLAGPGGQAGTARAQWAATAISAPSTRVMGRSRPG